MAESVSGLDNIQEGYIWRVGTGENINIYTDPWIPSSPGRKIVSPRGCNLYSKVSQLISPITGQWDEVLIREVFFSVDVNRILQIPLNTNGFEDFIVWNFTRHGRYTMRSGYYIQWRHQFGPRAAQMALPGSAASNPV